MSSNLITQDLAGKRVLVTGGGKGIGKGIALAFARRGAKVAIGCNANAGMAAQTLNELKTLTDAACIQADVGTPEGCETLVKEAISFLGGLDVFVNNAALQTNHSFLESSRAILKQVLNVNLRAAYLLLGLCRPYLKESSAGRAILVSSVHGKRPTDFDAAYSVSKGGMEMLCREAAIEFAQDGTTVNIIAPGAVKIEGKTGDPKPLTNRQVALDRQFSLHLFGRIGLPEDVAALACFLAGPQAEFITGTTLRVDGGSMLL